MNYWIINRQNYAQNAQPSGTLPWQFISRMSVHTWIINPFRQPSIQIQQDIQNGEVFTKHNIHLHLYLHKFIWQKSLTNEERYKYKQSMEMLSKLILAVKHSGLKTLRSTSWLKIAFFVEQYRHSNSKPSGHISRNIIMLSLHI